MSNLEIIFFNSHKPMVSTKHCIQFFYTYFIKHMNYVLDKFKTHPKMNYIVIYSSNIIFNVFWVVLCSSNNIFISLFLSEKSILLFTEFIIQSDHSDLIQNTNYRPTILDAIIFTYKKTIDNIHIDSLIKKKKYNDIINICYFFKELVKIIYTRVDIFNPAHRDKIIGIIHSKYYTFEDRKGYIFYTKLMNELNL